MILHSYVKKRKPKKPTAKQRELQQEWEAMMKKYEPKKPIVKQKDEGWKYSLPTRETQKIPSLPFTGAPCTKKESPVYTGTKIKGIGTMHKSNSVPIFSDEQAVEIATMRRN